MTSVYPLSLQRRRECLLFMAFGLLAVAFAQQLPSVQPQATKLSLRAEAAATSVWAPRGPPTGKWWGIAMSDGGKYQTASIFGGNFYTSTDFGITWTSRHTSGSWTGVAMSADGGFQSVAGFYASKFAVSSDYSASWVTTGSAANWVGSAMSNNGKKRTAAPFGGKISTSDDYGVHWQERNATNFWASIAISGNSGQFQTAGTYGGQIFTSSDSGVTWVARGPKGIWRNVALSDDGKYQTATMIDGSIYTSWDSGVTWVARDVVRKWYGIAMTPDGKKQLASVDEGRLYVSNNYGETWTAQEQIRKWRGVAISYDGTYMTALVDDGSIYTSTTPVGAASAKSTTTVAVSCPIAGAKYPLQNPKDPYDVNHDGTVSAVDVLTLNFYINAGMPKPVGDCPDVYGDGYVNAQDSMILVDYVNHLCTTNANCTTPGTICQNRQCKPSGVGAPLSACNDGVSNNDGDTLIDAADPGCHTDDDVTDSFTYLPDYSVAEKNIPRCGNGAVDTSQEKCDSGSKNGKPEKCNAECTYITPPTGKTSCNDGLDNDVDRKIDLADPDCSKNPQDDDERTSPACSDGIDNNRNGWTDYCDGTNGLTCDLGCASPTQASEYESATFIHACNNKIDDDGDHTIDYGRFNGTNSDGSNKYTGGDYTCGLPRAATPNLTRTTIAESFVAKYPSQWPVDGKYASMKYVFATNVDTITGATRPLSAHLAACNRYLPVYLSKYAIKCTTLPIVTVYTVGGYGQGCYADFTAAVCTKTY